jgi:hypothetical protein
MLATSGKLTHNNEIVAAGRWNVWQRRSDRAVFNQSSASGVLIASARRHSSGASEPCIGGTF